MSKLTPETDWLRADVPTGKRDPAVRVDRAAGVIYGRVLAEKGAFKSRGRGEFDDKSLDLIAELGAAKPNGLKSRWTHPGLSADGLGKFLGRDRNIRRDGDVVRGDLHLDRTALQTPPGGGKPLGQYVMDLAESDPEAFGSSLVLKADKEYRLSEDGKTPRTDDKGDKLPPLWRPKALHAIDVVDEGDAVHNGFLSADTLDGLPDSVVRDATQLLDRQFPDADRVTIRARGVAYLDRYLDLRFDPEDEPMGVTTTDPKPDTAASTEPGSAAALPALQSQLTAMLGPMLDDFRKQLRAEADAVKADLSASTAEVRKQQDDAALAAVHQRIDGVLDPAALAGKLTPGEKQRKRALLLTQNWRDPVKTETRDGREVPVTQFDLALADLTADLADRTPERFSERLRGGPGGVPGTVSAERQRELLALTPTGQSALEHAAKLLAAAANN